MRVPSASVTPVALPSAVSMAITSAFGADLEALGAAIRRDRLRDRAHAAADEAPAAGAGVLAHQVMRDHVGRARAFRPDKGSDPAVIREHRLHVRALNHSER